MYNSFAKYYDILMRDVDYAERADYIRSLFTRFGKMPTLLLDLACGTGGMSNEFASLGVSVIGVDISEEMLAVAYEKSSAKNNSILYLCQPAQELDLYGTVDGAVCTLDSLNHITDYGDFCKAIGRVSLFLEKDSLFIFDMNTVYKHENVLANNTFVIEEDGVYCVWQNAYTADTHTTEITLDFFESDCGKYTRSTESFIERAYTSDEIKNALESAGLSLIAQLADMSTDLPKPDTQRTVFVAKKI